MAQLLVLHDPLYEDEMHSGKTLVSTVTSNTAAFTLRQVKNYRQWHGSAFAPLLFERIADLPPHTTNLRHLVIEGAKLDGDALVDIFETHKHSLREVTLRKVILTKLISCLRALCHTETRRLELEGPQFCDRLGFELYVTTYQETFPKFKHMMSREWKLRAGFGRFRVVYERKTDTG